MANLLGSSMLPLAMARAVQPSSLWSATPANPAPNVGAVDSAPPVQPQSRLGINVGNFSPTPGLFFNGSKAIDDALSANAALPQKHGPDWKSILAYAVSGAAAGMGNSYPLQMLNDTMRDKRNQEAERQRFEAEQFAKQQERMSPRFEQVGDTIGMFDPGTYSFSPVYTAPGVSGQYALDRGFQPGTPEYTEAVQEQRLGTWSDPAIDNRRTIEDLRNTYRTNLQNQRLSVTKRGQDLNHQDRQASVATSRSNAELRADTTRGSYSYQHGGGGSGGRSQQTIGEGTIIKNPQTGQRRKMQGGKWVPIQ